MAQCPVGKEQSSRWHPNLVGSLPYTRSPLISKPLHFIPGMCPDSHHTHVDVLLPGGTQSTHTAHSKGSHTPQVHPSNRHGRKTRSWSRRLCHTIKGPAPWSLQSRKETDHSQIDMLSITHP